MEKKDTNTKRGHKHKHKKRTLFSLVSSLPLKRKGAGLLVECNLAYKIEFRIMEKLVSSWYSVGSIPGSYILPPEKRPTKLTPPLGKAIPVVDLGSHDDQTDVIQQTLKASQEFGFFQVINHGISKDLIDEAMSVFKEFHAMPAKDKAKKYSEDSNKSCKLYTSSEHYATEKVHFWRDALIHLCHPIEEYIQFWPEKPTRYRDVVGTYTAELRKLGSRILELITKGLGLSPGHFSGGLSENPKLLVNHYPPCPDPSLTLGLPKHRDPTLITILLQGDLNGLQVFKDEEWIGVEPIPHAFVVNVGYALQIISNGKLKGAEHRAVTNSSAARTTASFLIFPSDESIIEPEKSLINASNPPLYRAFPYKDFNINYRARNADINEVEEFISSPIVLQEKKPCS